LDFLADLKKRFPAVYKIGLFAGAILILGLLSPILPIALGFIPMLGM
jgi:hypothetical protein